MARRSLQALLVVSVLAGCGGSDPGPGPVSPTRSTVEVSPESATADGVATATVTVVARDGSDRLLGGKPVAFAVSGTGNAVTPANATTASDGTASATVASTRAETKTVTVTVDGVALPSAAVAFVPGPAASLVVAAAPSGGVAGETLSELRVAAEDAHGNVAALPGPVVVALAGGPAATLLGTLSAEPAGGVAAFADLSLQVAGVGYVLRASSGTLQVDAGPFEVAPAAAATSTVASSSSPVADGVATTTLTATLRDPFGNPVPGVEVTLTATGTGNTLVQPAGPTGADGTCTGTLASTRAEEKTVAAAAAGVTPDPTVVVFVPGAPDAAQSDFTAAPATAPADGTTAVALEATVRDAFGNAVPGVTVAFASSRAADVLAQPAVTGADGRAGGSATSAAAGTSILSGTMDGAAFAVERTVRFEGAFAASSPTKALAVAGRTCAAATYANTGRRLSVDVIGTVYLASVCGGEGFVAASVDGAKTFGTPVSTGMTGLLQISVQGGPDGVAYVAGTTSGGATLFSRTLDQGATWSAPVQLATGAYGDRAASIAVRGDDVFVQPTRDFTSVYRNAGRGEGPFLSTALPTNTSGVFWGLLVDSSGNLWSALDNPTLYVSQSGDGGATFSPWWAVGGSVGYSTWAIGADVIWVSGYFGSSAYKIPVSSGSATPTSTAVGGLATSGSQLENSIAVDAAGTAYVSQVDASGVRLQRARLSDAAFGAVVSIDADGHSPSLAVPPGIDKVLVGYEKLGEVWVTVQTY